MVLTSRASLTRSSATREPRRFGKSRAPSGVDDRWARELRDPGKWRRRRREWSRRVEKCYSNIISSSCRSIPAMRSWSWTSAATRGRAGPARTGLRENSRRSFGPAWPIPTFAPQRANPIPNLLGRGKSTFERKILNWAKLELGWARRAISGPSTYSEG